MADLRLAPLCAIGGAAPRRAVLGAVTLTEQPDLALAALAQRAGGADALAALARDLTGAEPPTPGRLTGAPSAVQLLWTGPGQWVVLAPLDLHPSLAEDLAARLGGAAAVTDQTDAWACAALEGPGTRALLERLCPLDADRMCAESGTRTGIAHTGCFVICDAPGEVYRVLGPRSSAISWWAAMEAVAVGLA